MRTSQPERDAGSYRDPSGFVFRYDNGIYRAVADDHWPIVEKLLNSPLWQNLETSGWVISTEIVPTADPVHRQLRDHHPEYHHFLRHRPLERISYPYEWSFSMLADAALLHLRLQRKLLEQNFSLKDASAFNVQFSNAQPIFVDVLSLARPTRMDIWPAYGQFCRMFLYPLLAHLTRRLTPRQLFLGSLDGLTAKEAYYIIGPLRSLAPTYFLDVFLQYLIEKSITPDKVRSLRKRVAVSRGDARAQILNLARLERKVLRLKKKWNPSSSWQSYQKKCTYSDDGRIAKADFVQRVLAAEKPQTVLDLGCNTGHYSRIAAGTGASVLAVDTDHDCIEVLYREASQEKLPILPLLVDIANPTPGVGFRNQERRAFLERATSECVLALALLHHLLVAARLSLASIRDLLADLTKKMLIIEYVDRKDPMFQTLLALRDDLYGDLTRDLFIATFSERFEVIEEYPIPDTQRCLYHLRKR